jgi:ParB family transcriptional regulator, chromosome partitioning protein
MREKRQALGKGLSALIPDVPESPSSGLLDIDIDLITPSQFQPRSRLDETGIEDLSRSIRANGVIQPLIVRRKGDSYELIAGERRWRAAQRAGLLRVPVILREVPPGEESRLLEIALIENIQREDLNPIEEATAYRRLIDEFHLTQEAVAAAVGKDRSSVANFLRLLRLPADVRQEVASGRLSMGHARALLSLDSEETQRRLSADIVARGLSVRQVEALVRKLTSPSQKGTTQKQTVDVHTRAAQEQLGLMLGTKVLIVRKKKGGHIRIPFNSEDELNRLYELIVETRRA